MSKRDEILDETLQIARAVRARRESVARSLGQSPATWSLLEAVQMAPGEGETVPQLARRLGLSRQSVQRVADHLAESGLVGFQSNPHHRRSPKLRLTDVGVSTLKALQQALARFAVDLDDDLEPEDVETTLYVLRAFRDTL